MMPRLIVLAGALAGVLALAGCNAVPGQLVSAQSPPGTGMVNDNSEPQPPGSLPPGAATSGTGVGQAQPSYLQTTFKLF